MKSDLTEEEQKLLRKVAVTEAYDTAVLCNVILHLLWKAHSKASSLENHYSDPKWRKLTDAIRQAADICPYGETEFFSMIGINVDEIGYADPERLDELRARLTGEPKSYHRPSPEDIIKLLDEEDAEW